MLIAGIVIVIIVAGGLIYLYRTDVMSFVSRPRKEVDHNEPLRNVVEGWKQAGYIDFSVPHELRANPDRLTDPHFFYLTVEEYRLVRTIGGGTAVERRWRRGSLACATGNWGLSARWPRPASPARPKMR